MKAAPVRPALTNPFPPGRDKSHVLLFASVNSYVVARTGWTGPHRFRFWVLDVASDWPLRLRVAGREVTRPAQSVAVYAPNVAYEEFMQRGNLMRQAWLMFRVADPRSPLSKLVQPDGFRIVDDPGSLVRTYIGQIAACFLHPHAGADWFARGAFYQILGLVRAARGEPIPRICFPDLRFQNEERSLPRRVESYLMAHPNGRVTAAEMAGHLGMSLSSFTHRYHEEAGETFSRTRIRLRIERAKPLLLRGDLPIKRIARELGFCDPAHFSNVFRRVVGMSPGVFVGQIAPGLRHGQKP